MAEYRFNDAVLDMTNTVREANQAVTQNAIEAYERNMAFVQNTFENGIEVLRSHADSTRSLLHEQSEQQQQVDVQAIMNTAIAAQERNVRYAQTTFDNATEVLKSHVRGTRSLFQTLTEQSQRQQEAFRQFARQSADVYVDLMLAPFSYFQQALNTAESIALQGVDTAHKIGRQGIETADNVSRQGIEVARQGVEAAQDVTRRGIETAEQISRQTAEAAQRTTRQAADAAQHVARQGAEAVHEGTRRGQKAAESNNQK